jgi:hypothetical protein
MWFTGTNYYKLAVEKDRDSIFSIHDCIGAVGTTSQQV